MATMIPNSFTSFDLTEDELKEGQKLTALQKQVIQNSRASIAEGILALKMDPSNQLEFVQNEAYLKGQLESYMHILICSESAEDITE